MWVRTAVDEERAAALNLLFSQQPKIERQICVEQALHAHEAGEFPLDHLLVAGEESKILGVCLAAVQSDRSGLLWPAVVNSRIEEPETVHNFLLQEALARFRDHHCWIGQAMLSPKATQDRERLTRNSFPFLTNLIFMERPVSVVDQEAENDQRFDQLTFRKYIPDIDDELFADTIEATYIETSDCPELRVVRNSFEALESHKISGQFDPRLWKVYFENDTPIGVVLLALHPSEQLCELVYFGVCHYARGRGLGKELLRRAVEDVQQTEAKRFFLAVDDRNSHAKNIYEKAGFRITSTNVVHAYLPAGRLDVH